jgi:Zn-dependent M28 family amino/carboxypeptidase
VGLLVCAPSREESQLWLNSQHPFYSGGRGPEPLELPTAIIGFDLAERILGTPPSRLRDAIDAKRSPKTFEIENRRARLEVALEETSATVSNVIARYPGQDEALSGEAVIVGAHLDHVGVDDRGRVYRGADDNAGGVAALLEVAEAFGASKPMVRRSVLFIAFTGEEKGLLGAYAYVKEPAVPMDKTYAMINMDIISRGRKTAIEATFPNESSVLERLMGQAVKLSGCRLKVGNGGKEFFQRSDQFAFHKAGVPSVFFNEGATNEDYHLWSDTPDKVLDDKVARVARLSFALAYLTANSDLPGGLK